MEQVKVILKLFVVMGVTWLSELCYFIVGWAVGKEIVWKYFAINDFINFSQGNIHSGASTQSQCSLCFPLGSSWSLL